MPFDERDERTGRKPTVRQIYALTRLLLEREGVAWPATRSAASELIERLRQEDGG